LNFFSINAAFGGGTCHLVLPSSQVKMSHADAPLKEDSTMNFRSILFPTDFSPDNDHALRFASTLAAESGAVLHIVHVDELRDVTAATSEAGYVMAPVPDSQEVQMQLERVVPTMPSVNYEHHYVRGSPVTEILALAESENVDLIVMASHGRTGLSRLLMGSIAEGVMRKAKCPVLIVKQPSRATAVATSATASGGRA
jgi:universal stress protein A